MAVNGTCQSDWCKQSKDILYWWQCLTSGVNRMLREAYEGMPIAPSEKLMMEEYQEALDAFERKLLQLVDYLCNEAEVSAYIRKRFPL
jgi:hypothetical protein